MTSDKEEQNICLDLDVLKLSKINNEEKSEKQLKSIENLPNSFGNKEEEAKFSQLRRVENKMESNISQILPRLYLSDDIIARNLDQLKQKRITHILNLTTNIPNKFEPEISYLKLTIFDFESQNIAQYFDEATHFIDEALKNEKNIVLVHCNAGISRSASFVIAYLIKKRIFKSYQDAYAHVKKCRPIISPNKGFEKQLLNLEVKMKRKQLCPIM